MVQTINMKTPVQILMELYEIMEQDAEKLAKVLDVLVDAEVFPRSFELHHSLGERYYNEHIIEQIMGINEI